MDTIAVRVDLWALWWYTWTCDSIVDMWTVAASWCYVLSCGLHTSAVDLLAPWWYMWPHELHVGMHAFMRLYGDICGLVRLHGGMCGIVDSMVSRVDLLAPWWNM